MRRMSLLLFLFLDWKGGLAAQGQTFERPAHEPVTEEVFLDAVDETHPASRALAGELGVAEAARLRASLLHEPRLEFAREAPRDLARETTWSLAWSLPIDRRRGRAIAAAEAGIEVEAHRLDRRRLDLRAEVRRTYAAWAAAEARATLLAEHAGRLEALTRWMTARAMAGEESSLAAWRMEIALGGAQAALAQARAAEAGWRERAAAWLDESDRAATAPPSLPRLAEPPADLDAEARPEVRAARARARQAESLAGLSRRVFAAPELMLGWKTIDDDPAALDRDSGGPVFAIGWQVPLFDRRRADRAAAESAVVVASAAESWAARRARSELAAALATYRELRAAALATRSGLERRSVIARAATASFEQGESTVTDLLDTLRALLEARLTTLDLHAAALEAHRQLELAAGRPLISGDLS